MLYPLQHSHLRDIDMDPLPQKRKASVSNAKSPEKHARVVSTRLKVSHVESSPSATNGSKVSFVPRNLQACLGGIPEELVLNIMQHLEDDPDALAKLCITDARCNRIAREVLYERISCTPSHYDKALAIARNRSLADCLRDFHWQFGEGIEIRRGGLDSPGWVDGETVRRELAVALGNARNIETIAIAQPFFRVSSANDEAARNPYWIHVFNSTVTPTMDEGHNRFTHLTEISITSRTNSIEEMSSLFRLPSLGFLQLSWVPQTTPFQNWTIPNSTCPIKDLSFKNSMVDISALTQMISSMKALQNLHYGRDTHFWEPFGTEENPFSVWPEHSWEHLGDALRQHRSSLETFDVFDDSDSSILDELYPDGKNFGVLGSFHDFQELVAVKAPPDAFLDIAGGEHDLSSCLPAHLKDFRMILTEIESLDHLPPVVASLKDVVCVGPEPFVRLDMTRIQLEHTPDLSGAVTTLEKAGIRVKIEADGFSFTPEDLRRMESDGEEGGTDIEEADI